MASSIETGSNAWRQTSNQNTMIERQATAWSDTPSPQAPGRVEIAYFGSSAFRITSPSGLSVMIDPWRNLPTRAWDWYFHDFPITPVDIGVSTHAHFDHDALHRLDAHVLLERLIGTYACADMAITGIADKHNTDSSQALYDFKAVILDFAGIDITPPDNPRSWDNNLIIVETGGLRILHWGDNRADPPDEVWQRLGRIDIALMPVDASNHVLGQSVVDTIIDRLNPSVVIPHHYYIYRVIQRQSTLLSAEDWVNRHSGLWLEQPTAVYTPETIAGLNKAVHCFGEHVAFDTEAWFKNGE